MMTTSNGFSMAGYMDIQADIMVNIVMNSCPNGSLLESFPDSHIHISDDSCTCAVDVILFGTPY